MKIYVTFILIVLPFHYLFAEGQTSDPEEIAAWFAKRDQIAKELYGIDESDLLIKEKTPECDTDEIINSPCATTECTKKQTACYQTRIDEMLKKDNDYYSDAAFLKRIEKQERETEIANAEESWDVATSQLDDYFDRSEERLETKAIIRNMERFGCRMDGRYAECPGSSLSTRMEYERLKKADASDDKLLKEASKIRQDSIRIRFNDR